MEQKKVARIYNLPEAVNVIVKFRSMAEILNTFIFECHDALYDFEQINEIDSNESSIDQEYL